MFDPPERCGDVRSFAADSPEYGTALQLLLNDGAEALPRGAQSLVTEFLDDAQRRGLSTDLMVGVADKGRVNTATLAVISPGRAALVLVPPRFESLHRGALECALRRLLALCWARRVVLAELLVSPDCEALPHSAAAAGFRFLTQLIYLRRSTTVDSPARSTPAADLQWITHRAEGERFFETAVAATYAESLDCPELTGLRPMADVLATHQAAGDFDPSLWTVAQRAGVPVGVILGASLPRHRAVEIVYMGVAPAARGTGVGDALLQRAVRLSRGIGATTMALAVDGRNAPARAMYARWGFQDVGSRDAWIATSDAAEA
ncbi:MAG: GNAT family N-acetyltransferase [Planctomycetota bacterium]